jgi:hypothetical protein
LDKLMREQPTVPSPHLSQPKAPNYPLHALKIHANTKKKNLKKKKSHKFNLSPLEIQATKTHLIQPVPLGPMVAPLFFYQTNTDLVDCKGVQ